MLLALVDNPPLGTSTFYPQNVGSSIPGLTHYVAL